MVGFAMEGLLESVVYTMDPEESRGPNGLRGFPDAPTGTAELRSLKQKLGRRGLLGSIVFL